MRKLVTVIAALAVAFSMMWCISSDAQAYTLRNCTVQKVTLNGQMNYPTGILVPADMLVPENKWRINPTDSYTAKHFYQGEKIRIERTVNGVKHYINTTVRGGFKPGTYVPIKFEVCHKSAETLHLANGGTAKWKVIG